MNAVEDGILNSIKATSDIIGSFFLLFNQKSGVDFSLKLTELIIYKNSIFSVSIFIDVI
jgi:hypothetical protein